MWDAVRRRRPVGDDVGAETAASRPPADGRRHAAAHRRASIGDVLFEADDIAVTYGGLRAVDRLSLKVAPARSSG